jgi:hypothetical protein
VVKIGGFHMEEDDPKKAFACFEESDQAYTDIYYHPSLPLFCLRICSRLMISISFFIMNEFSKAVENFIKKIPRTGLPVCVFVIFSWRYRITSR